MLMLNDDIFLLIIQYLDYRTLSSFFTTSKRFRYPHYKEQFNLNKSLRSILNKTSKFNTGDFSIRSLITLCKITTEKSIISCGDNHICLSMYNELTGKSEIYTTLPNEGLIFIDDFPLITQISSNGQFSLLLDENNQIYAIDIELSTNDYNYLTELYKPEQKVKQIAIGEECLLLYDDGTLWFFDSAIISDKILDNDIEIEPIFYERNISLISERSPFYDELLYVANNNELYAYERGSSMISEDNRITKAWLMENIISISARNQHFIILTSDANMHAYGYNDYGELGLGDVGLETDPKRIVIWSRILQVSAGDGYTLALTTSGKVYGFGCNISGQLALSNDIIEIFRPIELPNLKDIIQVYAGKDFSVVMDSHHRVYAFGMNFNNHFGLVDQIGPYSIVFPGDDD